MMRNKLGRINTIYLLICISIMGSQSIHSQPVNPERDQSPTIRSIKFFKKGEQTTFPVIRLGKMEDLELHFDDLQSSPKNYYYTYILCNADWSRVGLSQMDYVKGFTQNRVNQYRQASATLQKYFHYYANLPDRNCIPSKSGNYLLKVFLNGDTSQEVFSRRMLVVDDKVSIAAEVQQPFDQRYFRTHQKLVTRVDTRSLDIYNPAQQLKIVVVQNFSWDGAMQASNPTFIRGKIYEYSTEDNFIFEGGKEYRWLDLRSFKLQSDRVASVNYKSNGYDLFVRPDTVRSPLRYLYYSDLNGRYFVDNLENVNPWWQGDYANVHFTFIPNDPNLFNKKRIFVYGECTGYRLSEENAMKWNETLEAYETILPLKNGFYSYNYVTLSENDRSGKPTTAFTEGNVWEAENQYSIMVYYKAFGGRSDELVSYTEINSLPFLTPGRR